MFEHVIVFCYHLIVTLKIKSVEFNLHNRFPRLVLNSSGPRGRVGKVAVFQRS